MDETNLPSLWRHCNCTDAGGDLHHEDDTGARCTSPEAALDGLSAGAEATAVILRDGETSHPEVILRCILGSGNSVAWNMWSMMLKVYIAPLM